MSQTIRIENVSVTLGGKKILSSVTATIEGGKLTAVIGPNGAGKTTLLKCIMGTLPYGGRITFEDESGAAIENPSIGYVPQQMSLDAGLPLTVDEFLLLGTGTPILFGWRRKRERVTSELLARVKGESLAGRKVADLSGGELQRILLAKALSDNPDILLLDEPASGIDVSGEELFCELLEEIQRSTGKTVVLVSHDLTVVTRHADFVVCLDRNVKCQGPPVEIMSRENLLDLFGPHSSLYLHGDEHDPTCSHRDEGGET